MLMRTGFLWGAAAALGGLLEAYIHWRAGLGWHGLHCVFGPVHRNLLPIDGALSLVAAAIATALEHARGTYATIMDADLEYDPRNIAPLLEPLLRGEADAVYGVRGFDARSAYSFWYVVGNKLVTLAANMLFNAWLSDIMTCQKVLPTALFRALSLREKGFGVEAEITGRLLGAGVRIFEVPISYQARSREEGKKLRAVDGLRVLRTLLRCRLDRRVIADPSRYVPDPPRARPR
jgi:hypothetical protein